MTLISEDGPREVSGGDREGVGQRPPRDGPTAPPALVASDAEAERTRVRGAGGPARHAGGIEVGPVQRIGSSPLPWRSNSVKYQFWRSTSTLRRPQREQVLAGERVVDLVEQVADAGHRRGRADRHAVVEVDRSTPSAMAWSRRVMPALDAAFAVGLDEDVGDLGGERVVLGRGHREQAQLAAYLEVVAAQLAEQRGRDAEQVHRHPVAARGSRARRRARGRSRRSRPRGGPRPARRRSARTRPTCCGRRGRGRSPTGSTSSRPGRARARTWSR